MIKSMGQISDRLLGMLLPSDSAAAQRVYDYYFCEDCSFPAGGRRRYRLTCTTGGYCYRSCTGPCWTFCQDSCRR